MKTDIPRFVQIEDNRSLIRDTSSMAIINVDDAARQRARAMRERILSDKARISNLETQVDKLTNLVEKLLEKNNNG